MSVLTAVERPAMAIVRVVGLTLLAGAAATVVGLAYRTYAREEMPEGLAVLVGMGVVGAWLNTTTALRQFIGGGEAVPPPGIVFVNVAAFVCGAAAAAIGARSGAKLLAGAVGFDAEVSRFVGTVGRFVAVELPEEIEEIDGYEPLDSKTRESLAGETLRFPRGLSHAELRERLDARLRDDYGVGHVDVELAADGTVEYLAAGGRAAGLGPTLAPGTVAVAVRADPAFSASAGDVVQVWRRGSPDDRYADPDSDFGTGSNSDAGSDSDADSGSDSGFDPGSKSDSDSDLNSKPDSGPSSKPELDSGPERVATAELRATAGDVVTLALDAADAQLLDPDAEYHLVTLPTEPRADREFSSRLRAVDETVGAITLAADSPLVGAPVGSIDATVVAVRDATGVETIPPDERLLAPEDTLYVVGRPDLLRRIEAAAGDERTTGGETPRAAPRQD